jgi:hypothetical protein
MDIKYWFTGVVNKGDEAFKAHNARQHGANPPREEYAWVNYMYEAENFDIPQHWIAW